MNTKTRFLSLLLALAVVFSSLPFTVATVSAEPVVNTVTTVSTESELRTAITSGGNIKLGKNISFSEASEGLTIATGTNVTIDLGGYTLSGESLATPTVVGQVRCVFLNYGTLTVKNGTLKGGRGYYHTKEVSNVIDGGTIFNESTLCLDGITITGGTATSSGGGICNNGTAEITNVTVKDCKVPTVNSNGGGIFNGKNCNATLKKVTVTNCSTGGSGGGIENCGGKATLTDVEVKSCEASNIGGGIDNSRHHSEAPAEIEINKVTVENCQAQDQGGGIANGVGCIATLTDVKIDCCTATNLGGGMYNAGGTAELNKVTMTECVVTGDGSYGAGICNGNESSVLTGAIKLNTVTIEKCQAPSDSGSGGGIYNVLGGTAELKNVTMTDCSAVAGGGINNLGIATLTDVTIDKCKASYPGGGIENNGTATLTRCDITNCEVTEDGSTGGGIDNGGGATVTLTGCNITGCKATGGDSTGGGINNWGTAELNTVTIEKCKTTGKDSTGGGIYNGEEKTTELKNVTITDCSAEEGGGVCNFGIATLTNVDIANCTATNVGSGGGVHNGDEAELNIDSSKLSGCTASLGGGVYNLGIATLINATITNCTATNGSDGTYGGGIYNGYSTATLTNVDITNCQAVSDTGTVWGGGVSNILGTVTINGGSIKNCTANQGGGVYNSATATLNDVEMTGCSACAGGGVFNFSLLTISGNTKIQKNFISGTATPCNIGQVATYDKEVLPLINLSNYTGKSGITVYAASGDEEIICIPTDGIFATVTDIEKLSATADTTTIDDYVKMFIPDDRAKYHVEATGSNLALVNGATKYQITKVTPTNGDFTISTMTDIASGINIYVTPTAITGYEVNTVLCTDTDGNSISTTKQANGTYTFKMPESDVTVSVTFKKTDDPTPIPETTTYTITATATDGGTITPSGTVKVEKGKNKSFTATPDDGYTLTKFVVDGKDEYINGNTYTFEKVNAKHTIQAVFTKKEEPQPEPEPEKFTGWKETNGKWQYIVKDNALTGWQNNIKGWEGQWFYFDKDGIMQVGWYNNIPGWGDKWFYFDRKTGVMQKGWAFVDDGHGDFTNKLWYYLDPTTGAMQTDWQKVNGKWYYLDYKRNNWGGAMQTGWQWLPYSGGEAWFCFASNGAMYENCTTPDGYYVDQNGVWTK